MSGDFDFFKRLNEQMAEQDKSRAKEQVLLRIRERMQGVRPDFCATVMDDRWSDHVTPEAFGYLADEEAEALEKLGGTEAACEGANVVIREFVLYLCECYEIKPDELGDVYNETWLRHD